MKRALLFAFLVVAPRAFAWGTPDWVKNAAKMQLSAYPADTAGVVLLDETTTTVRPSGVADIATDLTRALDGAAENVGDGRGESGPDRSGLPDGLDEGAAHDVHDGVEGLGAAVEADAAWDAVAECVGVHVSGAAGAGAIAGHLVEAGHGVQ